MTVRAMEAPSRVASAWKRKRKAPVPTERMTSSVSAQTASSMSASLGGTYRIGAVVLGVSWSSAFISGAKVNDWVADGADVIDPINQLRLRLGMTF